MIVVISFILTAALHGATSQADTEFNYTLESGYPIGNKLFGNIVGIDVDKSNNIVIFHRGSHRWEKSTFDENENYRPSKTSPISEETVVTIDPKERKVIRAWGRDKFFIPHGLSLDREANNVWLTDCALHQVFKYSIDGSQELLVLGTAFTPGNDDTHFCKPTSVADTGEFVFVADGYCNSRVVMFSAEGKYLGEFGQSAESFMPNAPINQPTFYVPHKIIYAQEAKMLCVADRENGRIQCFTFEPRHGKNIRNEDGFILNGAIKQKFTIADPLFNGRLFSIDYSPIGGGIIAAVSGVSLFSPDKLPMGFVYNVTTGQLLSKFSPPSGKTFGMAHDLAISTGQAESIYVVDASPTNIWKFSRPFRHMSFRSAGLSKMAGDGLDRAMSILRDKEHNYGNIWYIFLFCVIIIVVMTLKRARSGARHYPADSLASLYSNSYSTSINSLFANNGRPMRRFPSGRTSSLLSTTFSRRAFFNLFNRNREQQNDFSRIPLEDNSDDDKSDSDVEEFNITQATSTKINV